MTTKATITSQEKASNHDVSLDAVFKKLARGIYDCNPLYLVSACFFLYSMKVLFGTDDIWMNTAVPMGIFVGYTLLLTGTTVLIVRVGKVWDDARTLLMVILLMFVVMSIGLDGKIMKHYDESLALVGSLSIGGLSLVFMITELLVMGLKMRLDNWSRSAYYSLFGLFFLYPPVMCHLMRESRVATIWGTAIFPCIAAVCLTLLIPVVRRGARRNGTPWNWPWFPFGVFALLGVAAGARTYLIDLSFFPGSGFGPYGKMESGFGFYMLIPLVFSALILLLERALVTKDKWLSVLALSGPGVFFLLMTFCLGSHSRLYYEFYRTIFGKNVTPAMIALATSGIFYLYATIRGAKFADSLLLGVLLGSAFYDVKADFLRGIHVPRLILMYGVVGVLILKAIFTHRSFWAFSALCGTLLCLGMNFKGTWFASYHWAIPIHLFVAGTIVIAFLYNDEFVEFLRNAGALCLSILCLASHIYYAKDSSGIPYVTLCGYQVFLLVVGLGIGMLLNAPIYLVCSLVNLSVDLVVGGIHFYRYVIYKMHTSVKLLFWGILFFVAALGISLRKGKIIQKLFTERLT